MTRYLLKRCISAIPLLWGLLTITFFVIHLAPGDPTAFYIQGDIDPKFAANLRHSFRLDEPLYIQYLTWLGNTIQGDFGMSFSANAPVRSLILATIPNTLLLTVFALLFDFGIGMAIGTISAIKRGTKLDRLIMLASLFIYSIPEFWLGLMLMLFFSNVLPWLPASGMYAPLANLLPPVDFALNVAEHLILPVFVLGVASAAATGRYMRGSMLDVIQQDYIRTARAKGLPERVVIGKHALKNAMLPIVTLLGLSLPFLLGGAVIVETVFAWPGMGKLTVDAIFTRDYPLIIGCTTVAGVMVIVGNILADMFCAIVDPRIRLTA
jgi:peptide/nickel transport system permease protein